MAIRLPPNLHSLYLSGMYPLGVECLGCKRRAFVPAERFGGKSPGPFRPSATRSAPRAKPRPGRRAGKP